MSLFKGYFDDPLLTSGKAPFTKQYLYNVGYSLSQFLSTVWCGAPDETLCSRLGRNDLDPNGTWWPKKILRPAIDYLMGEGHCFKSIEYDLDRGKELISWSRTDFPGE